MFGMRTSDFDRIYFTGSSRAGRRKKAKRSLGFTREVESSPMKISRPLLRRRTVPASVCDLRAVAWIALCVIALSVVCGCGPAVQNAQFVGAPITRVPPVIPAYRIHVGDHLSVRLFYNADLNQDVVVRPDGRITLQLVNEVTVINRTPMEVSDELTNGYGQYLEHPETTVVVASFGGQKVFVGGEVMESGPREILGPTTVLQAIAASKGFKDSARTEEVVLIRRGEDDKPTIISLNLKSVMDGTDLNQDIYLLPYDIVLVPRSKIADVNLWVDLYIRRNFSMLGEFAAYYNLFGN